MAPFTCLCQCSWNGDLTIQTEGQTGRTLCPALPWAVKPKSNKGGERMSAFVVSKSHINAIIQAGLNVQYKPFSWYDRTEDGELKYYQLTMHNASEVGQMLLDECVHSVSYRYGDDSIANLPGPSNAEWLLPFEWKSFVKRPTALEAIKIIGSYKYQSCEHPEWRISNARAFCNKLIEILVTQLPGYDGAPWTWDDDKYYLDIVSRISNERG